MKLARGSARAGLVLCLAVVAQGVGAQLVPDRVPVLLVPGWGDTASDLEALATRFAGEGWPASHVAVVDFEDPFGSNVTHAEEIRMAAEGLRRNTGSAQLDVVAHSMGGLATRYWLARGGAEVVRRAVFVATPHHGTWMSLAAWGEGALEMRPGSGFLAGLSEPPGLPASVAALTLRSATDFHIVPNRSATLPGVPDVEVCCPTHAGLLDDDDAFEVIREFLLRQR